MILSKSAGAILDLSGGPCYCSFGANWRLQADSVAEKKRRPAMFFLKFLNITDKRYLNALSQAGTIGLHMVSGIIVGGAIGYALDKWLETSPTCLLIFLAIGIVAGFKNVYVDTKRLLAAQKREDEEQFSASARGAAGKNDKPGDAGAKKAPDSDKQTPNGDSG